MIKGEQYAAEAAKLLGRDIPYVPGGSSLSGMDCDGLPRYIEKQLGLPLPDKKGTNYRWRSGLISEKGTIEDCTIRWGMVPLGTIICLRKFDGGEKKHGYTDGFNIDHVYVKIEGGLIHASQGNGKVVFREFADKEIHNGGPNTYCMRGDVVYSGKRVPSDVGGQGDGPTVSNLEIVEAAPELPEAEDFQEEITPQAPASPSRYFAVVYSPNGDPVNMREKPSKKCDLYKKIPVDEIVTVIGQVVAEGRAWSRVERNSRKWYIASEYLRKI